MDKKFEKIYEIAEREGWQVDFSIVDGEETDAGFFSFEKDSPAGRDFSFGVRVPLDDEDALYDNVKNAILAYWEEFDVGYETYIWLDDTGHGMNGAPHDMGDLYDDTEACEAMIYDLWLAFRRRGETNQTEDEQYVFEVFECDTWLSTSSMTHKATCNSLEEAVDLIMANGEFDECSDKNYIRDFLMENMQTPTGCIKYIISGVEVGVWN